MVQGWEIQYIMVYMLSARVHTFEVKGGGTLGQQGEIQFFLAEAYRCAFETETAKSAGRVRPGSQVNMLFKSL